MIKKRTLSEISLLIGILFISSAFVHMGEANINQALVRSDVNKSIEDQNVIVDEIISQGISADIGLLPILRYNLNNMEYSTSNALYMNTKFGNYITNSESELMNLDEMNMDSRHSTYPQKSTRSFSDDVDWWPMFHHDPNLSGYSTSKAPNTNNTMWISPIGVAIWASTAVVDGKVFVSAEDDWKIYCLDSSDGSHIWNFTTGYDVLSSPAVVNGKVYVGSADKKIYCLNAGTGNEIWNFSTDAFVTASPVFYDDKIYKKSHEHKVY